MLSNDSLKLLKWFAKQDRWIKQEEIQSCKHFDDRSFNFLIAGKYLDRTFDLDGSQWAKYRISEFGKAYLKGLRARRLPELREWINAAIPLITFLAGLSLSEPIKTFLHWLLNLFT